MERRTESGTLSAGEYIYRSSIPSARVQAENLTSSALRRVAHAGSFIRPRSQKIVLPKPFLATLKDRYVATTSESTPLEHESVILGRSGIEVEAPNLAKVRKRLAKLRELREIGVDDEGVGGMGEGEGEEMNQMGEWSESPSTGSSWPQLGGKEGEGGEEEKQETR